MKLANICSTIMQNKKPYNAIAICIIYDITGAVYRKKEGNFIIEMKVIDETINDTQLSGIMNRNASVFLVSKNKQEIEEIGRIGDVVILSRFTFNMWNGIKLETKYTGGIQSIYTINYQTLQLTNPLPQNCHNELNAIRNNFIHQATKVRNWFHNNPNIIYKPIIGLIPLSRICMMIEPFNIILRISNIHPNHLTLTDGHNSYTLKVTDIENKIMQQPKYKIGEHVIIRQVKYIDKNHEIKMTLTGCANVLPSTFKCQQYMNYVSVYWEEDKSAINKPIEDTSNNLTYLLQNQDSLRCAYLEELTELQLKYDASNKKEELSFGSMFQVNVIVIRWEGSLKLYHCQYQMIIHENFLDELTLEERKETIEQKNISYVFEGRLAVMDRSIENTNKVFYIELFNSDEKGMFFHQSHKDQLNDLIGTSKQESARKNLWNHIKALLDSLVERSNFTKTANLLVECIKSDKLIYRMVNTMILMGSTDE